MPDKILPLASFFDPMKAAQLGMMADRLDLAEENQALAEQRAAQAQAKVMMEERRNSLKEALPMLPNGPEKVKGLNELLNIGAGPKDPRITITLDDLNADGPDYLTLATSDDEDERNQAFQRIVARNPKVAKDADEMRRKQSALVGYGQFLDAAGLPNTPETRAAIADSGAIQQQVGQVVAETDLDRARADEIKAKVKERQSKIAGMNVGAKVLLEGVSPVKPIIELGDKYMAKLDALHKSGEKGLAYQGAKIARAGDPQFAAYLDGLKERMAPVYEDLAGIYKASGELDRMKDLHIRAGEALPKGETLETINSKLRSYELLKDIRNAEIEYYENPTSATLKQLKAARDAANGQVDAWAGEKKNLDAERLELASKGQALNQEKFKTKKRYDEGVASGQADLLEAVKKGEDMDTAAARIARQYKVKPADIKTALNDPTKKGQINLNLPGSTRDDAYKAIKTRDLALGTIGTIDKLLEDNPDVAGIPGMLQRGAAGYGQQLTSLVTSDPRAAEWLNTKPADEFDALQEILVWQVARATQGGGTLTEKDVEKARRIVGTLNSGGPQQIRNKLKVVKKYVLENGNWSEDLLREGAGKYEGKGAAAKQPATAEDFLRDVLGIETTN